MSNDITILQEEAVALLKRLISTPSFSKEEDKTALLIDDYLATRCENIGRVKNNIHTRNRYFDDSKPTILLNSHHDTVKPNIKYTLDPYDPIEKDGRLYGLGSNDAGGCLVSLIAAFLHFYDKKELKYNFVFAASAEEEISGKDGIELLIPEIGKIDFALVGEPTLMQMAVAERGLMVLDCVSHGKAGHAARNEGENAIYKAMKDIEWFNSNPLDKISPLLGASKMSVTSIETENKAHNVVPAQCNFVVDTRVNELYTFEEVLTIIEQHVACDIKPRSMRLRSTSISLDHPIVKAGTALGRTHYGSPTTSDKALMPFASLKMGPGDSARSHSADEFIFLNEIKDGIVLYIRLLESIVV